MKAFALMMAIFSTMFVNGLAFSFPKNEPGVNYNCSFPVEGVTIDALAEEAFWELAPWEVVTHDMSNSNNPGDNDEDASYEFACAADDKFLYFFVKIKDDIPQLNDEIWQGDGVEIYIDGGHEEVKGGHDDNDGRVVIGRNGTKTFWLAAERIATIDYVVVETDTGWAFEVAIPVEAFDIKVEDGAVIGLTVQLNDNDVGGDRAHKLSHSKKELDESIDGSYQEAWYFADLTFVNQPYAVSPKEKLTTTWASVKD